MFCPNCGTASVDDPSMCPTCHPVTLAAWATDTTPAEPPMAGPPSNKIVITLDDPPASDPVVPPTAVMTPVAASTPPIADTPSAAPAAVPAAVPARQARTQRPVPEWKARPAPASGTNGMAVGAFVCGLLGISAVAIVLGFVARESDQQVRWPRRRRGLALAGIILGFIWVGITILIFISLAVAAHQLNSQYPGG